MCLLLAVLPEDFGKSMRSVTEFRRVARCSLVCPLKTDNRWFLDSKGVYTPVLDVEELTTIFACASAVLRISCLLFDSLLGTRLAALEIARALGLYVDGILIVCFHNSEPCLRHVLSVTLWRLCPDARSQFCLKLALPS